MPQIIPLVVTAITTVTSAVVAAGPLAVAAFNAVNVIGAGMLANEAFKAFQPTVKSSGSAIEWTADPNAPNRFPFGRVGGAGNIIHNATYGPDEMYVGFVGVLGASGPINRYIGFKADDVSVAFDASGKANSSYYANVMWLDRLRGEQPETRALASPSGLKNNVRMPDWGSTYRLSGKAAFMYTLAENSKRSAYRGKVPTGIHTFEGLLCYDPRKDSTYPGGSGPCRLDDPRTWIYSINGLIHALNWNIGRWEGLTSGAPGAPYASMKVGGIGARPDGIDFEGYVEAANVFDANAWASAGWPDADQGKAAVLDSFLQASGAIYAERKGRISCMHRAAPRTSILTITADDTAGTIEYDTTTSLLERINTIRPQYWSEQHGWTMVATDEVTANEWRIEDGQGVAVTKSKGLDYNYVPGSKQARELAALQIAHTREGIRGTAPLRHYLDLEVGDCFTFQVPEAVLNGQKCIVLNVDPDLENDTITVTFASESDEKYPFAFGQTDKPPPAPSLVPSDPTYVSPPNPEDWVIEVRPPSEGGVQVPGFDLSGAVGNATATAVQVEWWMVPLGADPNTPPGPAQEDEWVQAGIWPPTTKTIPIDVPPGRSFWIGLSYIRGQNTSARTLDGPRLSPGLIAGGLSPDAANKLREDLEAILDASGPAEELAEVVLETIMNERDALEAEASQRVDDLLQEAAARGTEVALAIQQSKTYIDDYKSQSTLTFATINAMNGGLAATLFEAQSYTTGQVSSAMLTVYTKAQTDAGLASTLQTSRSYTDVYKSEAGLLFSTKTERANGDASAVIEAKSYTDAYKSEASLAFPTKAQMNAAVASTLIDSQSYSDGKLATSLTTIYTKAQTDAGRSATLQEAKSYTDALESYSKLNFSTKAELNGVSGQAALALSAAVGADGKVKAKFGLATQVGNLIVGMESENDGVVGLIKILSSIFQLLSTSSSDRAEFSDGIWYFYEGANTARAMVGRPFGGGHKLILWCGPASVALGAEGKDNAYVYVSMNSVGGPRFGGSDVPTGSGAPFSAKANSTGVAMGRLGPGNVKTNLITITVQNAKGPVTYQWFKLSGDDLTITAPTSASTQFEGNIAALQIKQAAFACIVTDTGSGVSTTILATGTVFDNSPI